MFDAYVRLGQYAYILHRLLDGDDVLTEAYKFLYEDGYTDEDGEWITDDDD